MHHHSLQTWQHAHSFGHEARRPAENRTRIVIALTAATMLAEIAAGVVFGSMALLADGLHMASHATALAINALAYSYARKHARTQRFSFGTGKVNALGGFTGAVLLAAFAAVMAWESARRLVVPAQIAFDQAISVAALGLLVNGLSVIVLRERDEDHVHGAMHDHGAAHDHGARHDHTGRHEHAGRHDHNLRSAYLHVMADALTSVLAIASLLCGKYFGLGWMDPAMGVLGAVLVARWSVGLLRATSDVLLDRQGPEELTAAIRVSIESDADSRVADLHVWSIGAGQFAAVITVVAGRPAAPEVYKARLPVGLGLAHVSVEVCCCPGEGAVDGVRMPATT